GRDERSGPHVLAPQKPCCRRRACDADIARTCGCADLLAHDDIDPEGGACFRGKTLCGVPISVYRVDACDRSRREDSPQLDPALDAAAADRRDPRVCAGKMARGEGGC